jgi:hypothetical protein
VERIETLFLSTLDDLEARIASQDPYAILGASALIRKLLVDEYPLVDQINRTYRLKITFEVTEPQGLPPGLPELDWYTVQDGIDPDTAPPFLKRQSATRDQLLDYVLARINGRAYTLREIIKFEANVMGGVHGGPQKKKRSMPSSRSTIMLHCAVFASPFGNYWRSGGLFSKALHRYGPPFDRNPRLAV